MQRLVQYSSFKQPNIGYSGIGEPDIASFSHIEAECGLSSGISKTAGPLADWKPGKGECEGDDASSRVDLFVVGCE
jgi:hypothetical protein